MPQQNYNATIPSKPFLRVQNFNVVYGDATNPNLKLEVRDSKAIVIDTGSIYFLPENRVISKEVPLTSPDWNTPVDMVINATGLPLLDSNGNQRKTTLAEIQLYVLAYIRYMQIQRDNNEI